KEVPLLYYLFCLCKPFKDLSFTHPSGSESGCKVKDFFAYLPNFPEVFFSEKTTAENGILKLTFQTATLPCRKRVQKYTLFPQTPNIHKGFFREL
ncbi:hypothetical protein B5F34_02400, partial [Mediterranea sp. An20]|uniref:hypothetical protein n=1 Tax=Mediterranea sp. An20 TaxID=1965586 RepID=UPI000B561687